jgi:hypothetical protein
VRLRVYHNYSQPKVWWSIYTNHQQWCKVGVDSLKVTSTLTEENSGELWKDIFQVRQSMAYLWYSFNCIYYVVSNGRIICEWWVGKNFEGSLSDVLQYYHSTCLEGWNTTDDFSQDSQYVVFYPEDGGSMFLRNVDKDLPGFVLETVIFMWSVPTAFQIWSTGAILQSNA